MEGLKADTFTFDEAQQAITEAHNRRVEMVRLAAVEDYTALGLLQAKRIKELEVELAQIKGFISRAYKKYVESTDAADGKNQGCCPMAGD